MSGDKSYKVYGNTSRPNAPDAYGLGHHILEKIYQIEEAAEADGAVLNWSSAQITLDYDIIDDRTFTDMGRLTFVPYLKIEVISDMLVEEEEE